MIGFQSYSVLMKQSSSPLPPLCTPYQPTVKQIGTEATKWLTMFIHDTLRIVRVGLPDSWRILELSRPWKTLAKPWNKDPDDCNGRPKGTKRERKGNDKKGEHPVAHVVGCFASNDQRQDWERECDLARGATQEKGMWRGIALGIGW